MARIPHVIAGEKVTDAERTQPVYNPATGEEQHELPIASVATVEQAIAAAKAALPAWRRTSLTKRANVFFNLRQLLKQRTPELAAIVTSPSAAIARAITATVRVSIRVPFVCPAAHPEDRAPARGCRYRRCLLPRRGFIMRSY